MMISSFVLGTVLLGLIGMVVNWILDRYRLNNLHFEKKIKALENENKIMFSKLECLIKTLNDYKRDSDITIKCLKSDVNIALSMVKNLEKSFYTNVMNNPVFSYILRPNTKNGLPLGWYQYSLPEIKKIISYNFHTPHMLYTQTNCDVLKELLNTGLNINENSEDLWTLHGYPVAEWFRDSEGVGKVVTPLSHSFRRDLVIDYIEKNGVCIPVYGKTNYDVIKFFIKQGANTNITVINNREEIKLMDHPAMLNAEMILFIDSITKKS